MQLAYAREVYDLENEARKRICFSQDSLMTLAAKQVANFIIKHINARPSLTDLPLIFFAGKGNNGGDAIASAMFIAEKYPQKEIVIYSLIPPTLFNDEIGFFYSKLPENVKFLVINKVDDIKNFPEQAVIIDGLLGIGFAGECRENLRSIINFINEQKLFTISIDIPSGLNADNGTGSVIIRADITLTIGVPKVGLYINQGIEFSGIIEFLPIGLDYRKISNKDIAAFTAEDCRQLFPRRPFDTYKKTSGNLLIIAGSRSYPGAALAALDGVLAVNCGMIYLAIKSRPFGIIPNEVIVVNCDKGDYAETFNTSDLPQLLKIAEKVDTILIGPGLQVNEELKIILQKLLELDKKFVLDADAINLIARYPEIWKNKKAQNIVLTPHIGEAKRLEKSFNLGDLIGENRVEFTKKMAKTLDAYIVIKGAKTLVASPNKDEITTICGTTSYALGKGGSGDILSGVIASLTAKNDNFFQTINAGVYLHGASVNYIDSMSAFKISEIPAQIRKIIGELSPF